LCTGEDLFLNPLPPLSKATEGLPCRETQGCATKTSKTVGSGTPAVCCAVLCETTSPAAPPAPSPNAHSALWSRWYRKVYILMNMQVCSVHVLYACVHICEVCMYYIYIMEVLYIYVCTRVCKHTCACMVSLHLLHICIMHVCL